MRIGTKIMSLWCLETEILAEITSELAAILKMAAILKLFLANVILVFSAQKNYICAKFDACITKWNILALICLAIWGIIGIKRIKRMGREPVFWTNIANASGMHSRCFGDVFAKINLG